ncbi:MAG: VWA domain-containing protein [Armatimonadota bacterium]|nr:VWA domain-containing protein [Armatimonadota bacterium]MDW8024988.1 VWA domain-containing protein [Armatimonadota bacterium]
MAPKFLLLIVAFLSVYVYLSERTRWKRWLWIVALSSRMLAIGIIWLLLSQVDLRIKRRYSYNPQIHFLIDTSLSMRLNSAHEEAIKFLNLVMRRLKGLGKPPDIHIWAFGEALREIGMGELSSLKFADGRTRLIATIPALLRRLDSEAGCLVVMLTDGRDTDFEKPSMVADAIKSLRGSVTKWVIVGVGSRTVPNVSVELTPQFTLAFPASAVTIRCTARLTSGESYSGKLTISLGLRRMLQRQITLSKTHAAETFELNLSPPPGEHTIMASCSRGLGEQFPEDNIATAFIKTVERNIRALFIAGSPNPEFKFIKQALEEDGAIDLLSLSERNGIGFLAQGNLVSGEQVLKLSINRGMVGKFDIVILGNIDAASLPPRAFEELAWYVGERGGTLLVLGGERSLLNSQNRTFVHLLPTEPSMGEFINGEFSLNPTETGLKCAAINMGFGANKAEGLWRSLPKLKRGIILGRPKSASQILLKYNGVSVSNDAALVWHRYGAGKVIAFAPFDTWRWWMNAARHHTQPNEFLKFWQGIVRCMATPLLDNWITLTPDETLVDTDDVLTVCATYHAGLTLRQPKEVKLIATHESGSQATIKLHRHGDIYAGRIRLGRAGNWTFKPIGVNGNRSSVTVAAQLRERMRIGYDEAFLHAISKSLEGKFLNPEEAMKAIVEHAQKRLERIELLTIRVNSLPWLYLFVLALLLLEWTTRRWSGLN